MQTAKIEFIVNELTALLKKINPDIEQAEYIFHEKTGEEYVKIHFTQGRFTHACITADSLSAITRDVLRRIS